MTAAAHAITLVELMLDGGMVPVYLSSHAYRSKLTDTIGARQYLPLLVGDTTYGWRVSCVLWSQRTTTGIGDVAIANPGGRYDYLLDSRYRDASCIIRIVRHRASWDTAKLVTWCLIDKISRRGPEIVIKLKARDAQLDRPAQDRSYTDIDTSLDYLEGQMVPVCLGRVRQVEPVTLSPVSLLFECNDSYISQVENVYSGGSLATPPPSGDWDYYGNRQGFAMTVPPSARVTVDMEGFCHLDKSPITTEGEFYRPSAWTGATPTGWSITGTSGSANSVTQVGSVGCRWLADGNPSFLPTLSRSSGLLVANDWYVIVGNVAHRALGRIRVLTSSGGIGFIDQEGWFGFRFRAGASTNFILRVPSGEACDIVLSDIAIYRINPTIFPNTVTGLAEHLALVRGGFRHDEIDTTQWGAAGLPTGTIGYYTKQSPSVRTILDEVMASVTGWHWVGLDGKLRLGRLVAPDIDDALLHIDRTNAAAYPDVQPDLAPGLSDGYAGGRNFSPYREEELAGITFEDRPPFMAKHRWIRRTRGLAVEYAHARGADPIETLFYDAADVAAESARVVALYNDARWFVDVPVCLPSAEDALDLQPGSVVSIDRRLLDQVKYRRLSQSALDDDVDRIPLLVLGASCATRSNVVTLNCWR